MSQIALQTVPAARTLVAILMFAFVWPSFETSFALAQVTTAITPTTGVGNLGTTVTTVGTTVQITGGTRPGNETNLFHSFDQFNVGRPDTAQFLNTTPSLHTFNILGRVTGGTPSSIFGTIDTMSYPGANLFLMNPAGILFGPTASLNVGGTAIFTSADYLRFVDNARFTAIPGPTDALLSAAPVTAFGFLGSTPGAITVQGGHLSVAPGHTLALVGGNITIKNGTPENGTVQPAQLTSPGGRIYLASVASPGEILAETLDQAPNVNGQSFRALGTIQISQQSSIDTSGEGGGTILIRGGRLIVDDSTISTNTGDISFDATSILIMGRPTQTQIGTRTTTAANAGHIILKASGNIDMMDFALVESFSENSSGHAGNITISSSQGNVSLTKHSIVESDTTNSGGNAGTIAIHAPHGNIDLADHSQVFNTNDGTGTLGKIQITAHDLHLRDGSKIGSDNFGPQVAGNIVITLDGHLTLAGGSFINTGAFGRTDSADLIISSPDILITGQKSTLSTGTISSGAGGRLRLFTDNLQLADGGTLSSKSFIGFAGEIPSGSGGAINIQGLRSPGTSIAIDGPGSGIFTSTQGTGAAGAINLSAQSLTMTNGATITASSTGTNPGLGPGPGNISINAGQSLEMRDSSIKTEAQQTSGGNISIQAVDRVHLVNSSISTSVPNGTGSGGNITIDPNVVVLQNNSQVIARAVKGAGGNITITTPLFLADSSSPVSASSQFGVNGTVTIQSPTSNLSGSLGPLPSQPSQAHNLLTQRCAALANGQASSFVVAGLEQLPADPGGWLTSPLAFATLGENFDAGHAIAAAPATMPIAAHGTGTRGGEWIGVVG